MGFDPYNSWDTRRHAADGSASQSATTGPSPWTTAPGSISRPSSARAWRACSRRRSGTGRGVCDADGRRSPRALRGRNGIRDARTACGNGDCLRVAFVACRGLLPHVTGRPNAECRRLAAPLLRPASSAATWRAGTSTRAHAMSDTNPSPFDVAADLARLRLRPCARP